MKSLVVGLTGQSGSGKTTVSVFFDQAGFGIINCDKIAHEVLRHDDCKKAIFSAFPTLSINMADGEIDRKALGKIVFSDKSSLLLLNSITHPFILNEVTARIDNLKKNTNIVIVDAPTLFESGANKLCDLTVGVVAENEVLIKRLCQRDNISQEQVESRIKNQHDISFFEKNCDIIIRNSDRLEDLSKQANEVVKKLCSIIKL